MEQIYKMLNYIKRNKTMFIILIVVITLISFIIYLALTSSEEETSLGTLPTTNPTTANTQQLPTGTTEPSGTLLLQNVFPKPGEVDFEGTKSGIFLYFDAEVDPETLFINTEPLIHLKPVILADNLYRITLSPQEKWELGETYTITISKGIKAAKLNTITKEDIVLKYTITSPPSPQLLPPNF